jgi:CRISPR/Cas system-associated endonuclease Cas1
MHGSVRDQGSLVFDLIEEFRAAFADRVVLSLIGRKIEIKLDSSGFIQSAVRIKVINAFYGLWHKKIRWNDKMITPDAILNHQANALREMFEAEKPYNPFRFRW